MDISQNVLRAFDSYRNAHQAVADAKLLPPRGRHFTMGSRRRMQHAGEYVSQAGGAHAELERIHKLESGLARIRVEFNREQRTRDILTQVPINRFVLVSN